MPKLEVEVKHYAPQLTQPARYTIESVNGPQQTRNGPALVTEVSNAKNEKFSLFIPFSTQPSSRTNLGRLVTAFGKDTEHWLKKRIDITIENAKRIIQPVAK